MARHRSGALAVAGSWVLAEPVAHSVSETRFAIDAVTALRLVREHPDIGGHRALVGPGILRSHVMAMLYREVRAGMLQEEVARTLLEGLAGLKIRLLADRVSRARAWKLAREFDWDDTGPAEYLAVASLQADMLVTGDERLAAAARGIVELAAFEDLFC